jgi:hypothetical protein
MRADAKWYCQVNLENDPITEDEEDEIAFQAAINVLRDSVESGKNGLRLRLPSCTSARHSVSNITCGGFRQRHLIRDPRMRYENETEKAAGTGAQ